MKRKLALLLSMISMVGCISACGSKESAFDPNDYDIPVFEDTKGVSFMAYSGPTVANWSGSSRNVSTATDEHFQKLVDAGFNKIVALHEGAPALADKSQVTDTYTDIWAESEIAEEHAMELLALCEKYNVTYFVRDWPFYNMNKYWNELDTYEEYEKAIRGILKEDRQYIYSPAFAGMYGRDEPGVDQYERLRWQIQIFNEIMEEYGIEDKEFLLNLLPNYGSATSYGGEYGGEAVSYQEYINRYFYGSPNDEEGTPTLAELLGYISYDFYPFKNDAIDGSYMRASHLQNLEMLANQCKKNDVELRTYVQTGGDFTGLRDFTSIGDFRLQVYSNLAFGSYDMTYYEYGTFNSEADGEFGLINLQDGTYNYTYEMAKVVNNEVHAMEDALVNYRYDGVMCFSALGEGVIHPSFRSVQNKLKSHPRIKNVEYTEDTVITAMKDSEGNDAFMLLNYTDPYFDLDNRVTIEFKDADALLMYRLGQEMIVPLKNGKYTFELYPGEGRFIIPIKKK